jgi:cell division protease FtsH
MAREMIVEQGMGKKLRNMTYHVEEGGMMMDRMMHDRNYSEQTAQLIDGEIKDLIDEAAKRAEAIIKHNMKYLEKIKDALLEKETLDYDDVMAVLKGATVPVGV